MALDTGASGVYADVTGVVDATAAAEIVALFAIFDAVIDPGDGIEPTHPDFYQLEKQVKELIQKEMTEFAAAIAAAPAV